MADICGWLICITNLDYHWCRYWLVAWSARSHYLNQCCIIVNWTLPNKLQSNCILHSNISIQENAFQDVVRKMAAILSWPQCGNLPLWHRETWAVPCVVFGHQCTLWVGSGWRVVWSRCGPHRCSAGKYDRMVWNLKKKNLIIKWPIISNILRTDIKLWGKLCELKILSMSPIIVLPILFLFYQQMSKD